MGDLAADTVTKLIGQFGVLIFAFFFMSMAVETLLESCRGLLTFFGISVLQSKGTLDDALAEAADFVPEDSKAYAKFSALAALLKEKAKVSAEVSQKLEQIAKDLSAAKDAEGRDAIVIREAAWLSHEADPIKRELGQHERERVLRLRLLSAVIGTALAALAGINLSDLMNDPETGSPTNMEPWIGYIALGLASAGGSSYWHDWLDQVRKLKDVSAELALLKT